MIPYNRQTIDKNDIESILNVFEENTLLTGGKYVEQFENDIIKYIGCKYATAVINGTAALHTALFAIGIQEDDEIIVTSISFVASANCILYMKAKPIFCDINLDNLNIEISEIEKLITHKTKAILCVDIAGNPCDYDNIINIAKKYNLLVIDDAAHSLGGSYKDSKIGNIADITTFSFHPVKNITTCEGGMVVTNNKQYDERSKIFRSHGINSDFKSRKNYYYEMIELGFNYRIPDPLCALGSSQLLKLDTFINTRNMIAEYYNEQFKDFNHLLTPLKTTDKSINAYHLYIVKINLEKIKVDREYIYNEMKRNNISTNVHYLPIYKHPYYMKNFPCINKKNTEKIFSCILSLPIYPELKMESVKFISDTLIKILVNNQL